MRGAQAMFAEGIEKTTRLPVEFQHAVRALIEIGMRLAVETNNEGGHHRATTP
jgi:hypothetical protein